MLPSEHSFLDPEFSASQPMPHLFMIVARAVEIAALVIAFFLADFLVDRISISSEPYPTKSKV
jgi:hypothetical protein